MITFNDFIHKFAEAIEDDSIINLPIYSNFRDLDSWDSFSGMLLIAMIDNEFGLTINSDELNKAKNLEELYNLIQTKQ
jgi:acyl carrier protein